MIDEELRTVAEEVRERSVAVVRVEAIVLLDADPGQFASPLRQRVGPLVARIAGVATMISQASISPVGPPPTITTRGGAVTGASSRAAIGRTDTRVGKTGIVVVLASSTVM